MKKLDKNNKDVSMEFLDKMAKVISEMFGSHCEVCISDLSNAESSVVKIYNGHVTGRKVGSPLNETTMKKVAKSQDGLYINYRKNIARKGNEIKSSTILVNVDGKPHSFCINYECGELENLKAYLSAFLSMREDKYDEAVQIKGEKSHLELMIIQELETVGKKPKDFTKKDRIHIIKILKTKGLFEMQKSIPVLSKYLGVSRYTIYNYLNEIETTYNSQEKK